MKKEGSVSSWAPSRCVRGVAVVMGLSVVIISRLNCFSSVLLSLSSPSFSSSSLTPLPLLASQHPQAVSTSSWSLPVAEAARASAPSSGKRSSKPNTNNNGNSHNDGKQEELEETHSGEEGKTDYVADKLGVREFIEKTAAIDLHLFHQRLPDVQVYRHYVEDKVNHVLRECPSYALYEKHANALGQKLISLANPAIREGKSRTRTWFLADFSSASLVALAYIIGVILFSIVMHLYGRLFGGPDDPPSPLSDDSDRRPDSSSRKLINSVGPVFSPTPQRKNVGICKRFITRPILIIQTIYNIAQVALCVYMTLRCIHEYQKAKMKPICNGFEQENLEMAKLLWIFYVSKVFDFCDTFFIIARQNWKQLTFLHLYHHVSIFLIYWLNINGGYDGDIYLTILLNSGVHTLMYLYYLFSSLGLSFCRLLKPFVTRIQMIQFLAMEAQAIYLMVNHAHCPFPFRITFIYSIYIFSLLVLFQLFASREYSASKHTVSPSSVSGRGRKIKGA